MQPSSFLLTINNLRLRCGTKWYGVVKQIRSVEREAAKEEPVGIRPESIANNPNHLSLTTICAVLTSPIAVALKDARQTCD
jgi:hypothetical protein